MKFNDTFILGVADADLQVVGEANTIKEENSCPTIWKTFAETSGKVVNNDSPDVGIDRFHKTTEDADIIKEIGAKHYRLSISMARTLDKDGNPNKKALQWYTDYFKLLKSKGIQIYATLYHWELPQYLQETGGWENKKTIDVFKKHAETVYEELGEYIEEYFILNEPWCSSILSNFYGAHAPGKTDLKAALTVAHNLLLANGVVFEMLKKKNSELKVSTVFNTETAYAASDDPKDILAAQYADGNFNRWFFDPLFKGEYPKDMLELYGDNVPSYTKEEMETINVGSKLHTMGVNYYCGRINTYDDTQQLKYTQLVNPDGEVNDLGWPITIAPHYRDGLYDMLQQLYFSYKDYGLKRIYITENGMALKPDLKDGKVNDQRRIDYMKSHLSQVQDAIIRGVPVEGYFAWTLMDNYEWAEGYRPESTFGMVYIDRKTMKRIPKASYYWYKNVIETKQV